MRTCLRSVVVMLTLVSTLFLSAGGDAAADHAIELYRSEQYDYYFFYDAALWTIVDESSEPGSELVIFSDGDVFFSSVAFDAPGVTPRECVESGLDQLAAEPAIVAVDSLSSPPGLPEVYDKPEDALGPPYSSVNLIVTLDESDERGKLATRVECEELVPGESLLYTVIHIPATLWNAGRHFSRPQVSGWLNSVVKGYRPSDEAWEGTRPVPLVNATGDVIGTLSANPQCVNSETVYGVARNVDASADLVLDPRGFTAATDFDDSARVFHVEWLYPNGSADSPFVLQPGEVGLFKLTIPYFYGYFSLFYSPSEGGSVLLGNGGGGCAGGGAAPIVIDV